MMTNTEDQVDSQRPKKNNTKNGTIFHGDGTFTNGTESQALTTCIQQQQNIHVTGKRTKIKQTRMLERQREQHKTEDAHK